LATDEVTPTVQDNLIGQNEMLFENELYDSIQRSFSIKTKVSIFDKMQFLFPPVLSDSPAAPPCGNERNWWKRKLSFLQKWKLLFQQNNCAEYCRTTRFRTTFRFDLLNCPELSALFPPLPKFIRDLAFWREFEKISNGPIES